jgi:hypothetical protein
LKLSKEERALYNHITISLKVRQRCTEVGALMILDEIQPGFDAQENSLVSKIMMLYPTLLLWEKEWRRNACWRLQLHLQ